MILYLTQISTVRYKHYLQERDRMRRYNTKKILADPILRKRMLVPAIKTIQNREGINTTTEDAERAYNKVREGERECITYWLELAMENALFIGMILGIHLGKLIRDPLENWLISLGLLDEKEVSLINRLEDLEEEVFKELEK